MTEYKPITGTFAKPGPTLLWPAHICDRCGIEYRSRKDPNHCFDCRPMVHTP